MLEILDPSGPERANGNSNHGPIATEGAFQVKSPEAMLPWIESYVTCLTEILSGFFWPAGKTQSLLYSQLRLPAPFGH